MRHPGFVRSIAAVFQPGRHRSGGRRHPDGNSTEASGIAG